MKKIVFAMAMVSMLNANANTVETNTPAENKSFKLEYNDKNEKSEYEIKNGEVISKIVYKWNSNSKTWVPCTKYAISKNADDTILSCGNWNESTMDFSSNISCQSFPTSMYPNLINLPKEK